MQATSYTHMFSFGNHRHLKIIHSLLVTFIPGFCNRTSLGLFTRRGFILSEGNSQTLSLSHFSFFNDIKNSESTFCEPGSWIGTRVSSCSCCDRHTGNTRTLSTQFVHMINWLFMSDNCSWWSALHSGLFSWNGCSSLGCNVRGN